MIYFRGTDDKLWQANLDGSAGVNLGGYKTKSTPVVFGDFIYFQGTDDKLWKVKLDGTGGVNLAGYKTSSSPFLTTEKIYFQGTDNKLWAINLDGSNGTNLGGYQTKSSPFVAGQYVYFQGTDNKLWRLHISGTGGINLGLYQTKSSPFVTSSHVYFQGTDDKLWRLNLDGTAGVNLGGYKTSSTPCVTAQHVYFEGTDNKLWQINLDGTAGVNLGGYKSKSSPVVDTDLNFIFFQGTDNALWRINLDGKSGNHIGGFNTASMPFVVQASNQPQSGSAIARYAVLSVIYAPPGTNGGKSSSSVDYGGASVTGTTTSIGGSFKAGLDISATVGKVLTGDFSLSNTSGDNSSLDIKKTASLDITTVGPATDGINHDEDVIYLWLKPQVNVTVDPGNNLNWQLGVSGPTMIVQYVHVGWLKKPATMPPGLQQQFAAAGITSADYANILATNPFASGATAIDANRFLPTTFSFPYNPPLTATDPVPALKYVQTNSVTNTASHSSQTQYGVGLSAAGTIFSVALKAAGQLQWTNTSSSGTTNGTSQSATVVVGGPAFGYTGPTDVLVYWDTIYNSYMFAFVSEAPSASGIIQDKAGKPVAHQAVTLAAGTRTFNTFTDTKGQYRFYRTPAGPAKVSAVNEQFSIAAGNAQNTVLKLTKT
jgi:hypothetical protein